MKILFVFWNVGTGIASHPGLMMLSALAKREGHETRLWHIRDDKWSLCLPEDFEPDIVAATATDFEYKNVEEVARTARMLWPNAFFVLGGKSAIEAAGKDLSASAFDAFSIGEAEKPWVELLKGATRRDSDGYIFNTEIKGWWFKRPDGSMKKNPLGEVVTDLDELPMRDYDLFNIEAILREKNGWMSVDFTRGCAYACTYCYVNADKKVMFAPEGGYGMGNYLRKRSVESVIKEMTWLCEKYGPAIKMFNFDDELPILYKDWILEFCRRYKDEIYAKYGVQFILNGRIDIMNAGLVKALVEAGCAEIRMGFESGSFRIRKHILHKPISEEKMREAYRLCDTFGLKTSSFTMLGIPGECKSDIEETIRLTAELKPHDLRLTFCYPFENTPLWDMVQKWKILKEEDYMKSSGYFDNSPLIWPHKVWGGEFEWQTDLTGDDIYRYRQLFPWFVNAHPAMGVPEEYRWRYQEILAQALDMKPESFRKPEGQQWVRDMDKLLSDQLAARDIPHYCYLNPNFFTCRCKPEAPKAIVKPPSIVKDAIKIDATGFSLPWIGDPAGYWLIRAGSGMIEAAHCRNEEPGRVTHHVVGRDPREIYEKITEAGNLVVTRPEHWAYLGKELSRAYVCMKLGTTFIQDNPWSEAIPAGSSFVCEAGSWRPTRLLAITEAIPESGLGVGEKGPLSEGSHA